MLKLREGGLTELIGINEQVDQNDYSGSVEVALGGVFCGEITSLCLYTTEDDAGAVLTPAGTLFILSEDPAISAGDTAMSAAERVTVLAQIAIATTDWVADANGASAFIKDVGAVFPRSASLFFVWFHEDATSFNDGGTDDEQLEFNFWYRVG